MRQKAMPPHEQTQRPDGRGPALRVFLAEDDADLRSMLAELLRSDGHEVVEASSSTMLLMNLARWQLEGRSSPAIRDVVLSDVHMPGMDGINALRALRATGSRVPPFIFMTGLDDEMTRAEARDLGVAFVLEKPFDIAQLRSAVRETAARAGG